MKDLRSVAERVLGELEQVPPPWLVERIGGQGTRAMFRSVRALLREASSSAPVALRRDAYRVEAACYDVALALRTAEDGVLEGLLAQHGKNLRGALTAARAMRRFFSFALATLAISSAQGAAETLLSRRGSARPSKELSARELEVLQLLAEGRTVKEIAVLKNISAKTVSTYRSRLLKKLELRTTAALIRYAIAVDIGAPAASSSS